MAWSQFKTQESRALPRPPQQSSNAPKDSTGSTLHLHNFECHFSQPDELRGHLCQHQNYGKSVSCRGFFDSTIRTGKSNSFWRLQLQHHLQHPVCFSKNPPCKKLLGILWKAQVFLAPFQVGHPNLSKGKIENRKSLSFAIWSIHLAKWQWSKGMEGMEGRHVLIGQEMIGQCWKVSAKLTSLVRTQHWVSERFSFSNWEELHITWWGDDHP